MKLIRSLPLLFLLHSIPAFADASPEGCFSLASGDTEKNDSAGKEICLKSEKGHDGGPNGVSTGTYTITIRNGAKTLETYRMTSSMTDGSGSHTDFLFAAKAATLQNAKDPDGYARGRRGPIPDVIFYILVEPEFHGNPPLKSGDNAGSVTIKGKKYSLFKK